MNDLTLKIVLVISLILLTTQTALAVSIEKVSAPIEVVGAINNTGVPYIVANSSKNPDILYYDIELRSGNEKVIFPFYPNLTIPENEFNYITRSWVNPEGMINVAWLGEKYFVVENGWGKWILTKLLVDEDEIDEHTIRAGESLLLPEGFAITALEIDVDGKKVWLSLSKDGEELKNLVVREYEPYFPGTGYFVYTADLGASGDTEVLNFTVKTVFAGSTDSFVIINNIDLLSPKKIQIYSGVQNPYKNYRIVTTDVEIRVNNDLDIALKSNSDNYILDNSYSIQVNKAGDLTAFARVISEPGTYEIIGATNISSGNHIHATASNNPGILYYDIDAKAGGELLDIYVDSSLKIGSGNLTYSTSKWSSSDGGEFIGLEGKKFIVLENNATVWKIAEKRIDDNENDFNTLEIGESQNLGEGFMLTVQDIDVNESHVWFILDKDGVEVGNEVVSIGSNFVYTADLGTSNLTKILNFTVESAYFDMNSRFVKINNMDMISTHVREIRNGDTTFYTDYLIITNESCFVIKNNNNIVLSAGGQVDIINGIFSIRVSKDKGTIAVLKTIYLPEVSIISIPDIQGVFGFPVTVPIYIDVVETGGLGDVLIYLTYDPSTVKVISASSSDFDTISADIVNPEGYTIIRANQSGSAGAGPGKVKLADVTLQAVGKYGRSISPLGMNVKTFQNVSHVKVSYTAINGTFEKIPAGNIETVSLPYEITGAINSTGVSGISASSLNNPGILYWDFNGQYGAETIDLLMDTALIVGQGNLTYKTRPWLENGGMFVAWLGEKLYVVDNAAGRWVISNVLMSESEVDDHILGVGETLTLPEGWAITVLEVDLDGKKAWMSLSKDGVEVTNKVVKEYDPYDPLSGYFVYEEDLGAGGYLEVLNYTVQTVFVGMNIEEVKINDIDLISNNTLELINGDTSTVNGYTVSTTISDVGLYNTEDIYLVPGGINEILNNKFIVKVNKNGSSIGLGKILTENGMYEITGKIGAVGTSLSATSENCPGILYYDFEARAGGESLILPVEATLNIPTGELVYSSSSWSDPENGLTYMGWQGKEYLVIESSSNRWNIAEKLIDETEADSHLLRAGESLTLDEGYSITALEIDVDGQQARLSFSKDGIELNNILISTGSYYVYETDLGAADKTEVLNLTVESVFAGMNTTVVKINNIDLISTEVLELQNNDAALFDGYVVQTSMSQVTVTNIAEISLGFGTITNIIDGLFSIRVDEMGNQAALVKLLQAGVLPDGGSDGGSGSDTEAPTVNINSPSDGDTIYSNSIVVSGTASDNVNINVVEIKVGDGAWMNATGTASWSANVNLLGGTNVITARATDNAGNNNTTSISVVVTNLTDISISNSQAAPSGTVVVPIIIDVEDPSGLSTADITLTFNASVVNVISADNSAFDSFTVNFNNTTGIVRMVAFQTGATGVGPGMIQFANITLQSVGIKTEVSPLDLEVVTLKNNTGTAEPYQVFNGTFEIGLTGDFSDDNVVDLWDITYLARYLAGISGYETISSRDVSGDGVIDSWDCTYLARAIAGIPGYEV